MKKTKRAAPRRAGRRPTRRRGKPGRPTRKRLKHIAEDVMTQERRDRRALDRQAERTARKARKPDPT